MKKPKKEALPALESDLRWAAFLVLHSRDIESHANAIHRAVYGGDIDDDDGDGGHKLPPTRPLELV